MNYLLVLMSVLSLLLSSDVFAQTFQWVSRIGGPSFDPSPHIPDELINDIATDAQGNVYACGRVRNNSDINGQSIDAVGGNDILLAKFDCSGNLIWSKVAGNIDDGDNGISLALDGLGHIYLTGEILGGSSLYPINFFDSIINNIPGVHGMFLAKLDTSGNLIWGKLGESVSDGGRKLVIDLNGKVNVLFFTSQGMLFPGIPVQEGHYITRFDVDGNVEKLTFIDGTPFCVITDFKIDTDYNYYIIGDFGFDTVFVAGSTILRSGPLNTTEFFCLKSDSSGMAQWIIHVGSQYLNASHGHGLTFDLSGNLLLTGAAFNGLVLGTDTLQNSLSSSTGSDFPFVAKLTPQGQVLWARNGHTQLISRPQGGIAVRDNGNSVISGSILGTAIFGSDTITTTNGPVLFVAEYDGNGNYVRSSQVPTTTGGYNAELRRTICDLNDNILFAGAFDGNLTVNGNLVVYHGGYTDGLIIKWGNGLCSVGIDDDLGSSRGEVRVYPNPAREYIHFRFNQNPVSKATVDVYDVMGKVVRSVSTTLHTEEVTVDVQGLSPGIYSYSIRTSEMNYSGKFIVMD